ncbi:MAG TPA: biopolymer transporter ExbD [Opitutaceae bacterium]
MKAIVRGLFFSLVLAATVFGAGADLGQVVHIAIDASGKVQVDGKSASVPAITALLNGVVKDKEHTAVEIRVPAGVSQATIDQVKDACRRAGLSKFSIVTTT